MKKVLIVVFCVLSFDSAFGLFFGMNTYVIEKNNIAKYPKGVYGVYIDYILTGPTKQSLTNSCIIQKDAAAIQPPECQRDKNGDFVVNYLRMQNLINLDNSTACVLNIMFYDKSDGLIQNTPLNTFESCQWGDIPNDTSIDVAREYLIKIEAKAALSYESNAVESKTVILK